MREEGTGVCARLFHVIIHTLDDTSCWDPVLRPRYVHSSAYLSSLFSVFIVVQSAAVGRMAETTSVSGIQMVRDWIFAARACVPIQRKRIKCLHFTRLMMDRLMWPTRPVTSNYATSWASEEAEDLFALDTLQVV